MNFETPNIITREMWGASDPTNIYFPQIPKYIIFHHYGFSSSNSNFKATQFFTGDNSIRYIQDKALHKEGLIDIPFHYIIVPNGDIYEGRPPDVMGKHCNMYDKGSIGIMCFGNFNSEQVPDEMKISIVWLVRKLVNDYKTIKTPVNILCHRDKEFTSCPGANLQAFIMRLKRHCQF